MKCSGNVKAMKRLKYVMKCNVCQCVKGEGAMKCVKTGNVCGNGTSISFRKGLLVLYISYARCMLR